MREHPATPGASYDEGSRLKLMGDFLAGNRFAPLLSSPDLPRHRDQWRDMLANIVLGPIHPEFAERLHVRWHECHHFLRELVEDDALLIKTARAWLPPYSGTGLTLYRGENLDRFESGRLGFAWTPTLSVAEMFGSGLNAIGSGGVVLLAHADRAAIVAGPSRHSLYMGEHEFTVDPNMLGPIEVLSRFPPSH